MRNKGGRIIIKRILITQDKRLRLDAARSGYGAVAGYREHLHIR